jgi:Ca2+-binding EF-hand superfamily protein
MDHPLPTRDTDRSGTVSKHEFLQFMSRKFERLDTNRNGKLERNELRSLVGKRLDRILDDGLGCAPWEGGAFQWV